MMLYLYKYLNNINQNDQCDLKNQGCHENYLSSSLKIRVVCTSKILCTYYYYYDILITSSLLDLVHVISNFFVFSCFLFTNLYY